MSGNIASLASFNGTGTQGTAVVDKVENCYPMIPSGKPHNQMLLGPEDEKEEVSDEGKTLV